MASRPPCGAGRGAGAVGAGGRDGRRRASDALTRAGRGAAAARRGGPGRAHDAGRAGRGARGRAGGGRRQHRPRAPGGRGRLARWSWLYAPTVPAVRWRPWRVPHAILARRRAVRRLPRADLPGPRPPVPDRHRRAGGARRARRPGRRAGAGGGGGVRILLWHVHGSWTTAFVQGPHHYLVPVLPDRGPDGRGRAQTYAWPDTVRELPPEALRRRAVRRRGAPAAPRGGARRGVARRPPARAATCPPSTSSTTPPRGGSTRCATRWPTGRT